MAQLHWREVRFADGKTVNDHLSSGSDMGLSRARQMREYRDTGCIAGEFLERLPGQELKPFYNEGADDGPAVADINFDGIDEVIALLELGNDTGHQPQGALTLEI